MKHSASALATTVGGITLMTAVVIAAAPDEDRFPISVEQLEAKRTAVFAETDQNGDGLVSAEEFDAHAGDRMQRSRKGGHPRGERHPPFDGADAHMAEMEALLFSALDVDGDGFLSDTEFSHAAMAAARKSLMQERRFNRLDADDDGYLSPEEFPPRRLAEFDADGNGEISRDELPQRRGRPDAD